MARLRRSYTPGVVHHAIARFHNGEFRLRDSVERNEYLRRLALGLREIDWLLLAYALMSSHVHLLFLAGILPPEALFNRIHSPFGRWLNDRQGRLGYLFADRYRLWAVKRPTAELIAYLHNNPVRACVVPRAADSTWTSHRYFIDPRSSPPWLRVDTALQLSGLAPGDGFDAYVNAARYEPRDPTWRGAGDGEAGQHIRSAGGSALDVSEPVIADVATYGALLRPRAYLEARSDFTVEQVLGAVAAVVGTPEREFRGRSKTSNAVRARRLALRVWRGMRGTQQEMCAALGMSPSAACGLLSSTADRHRDEDEERVWAELLRRYPQRI